MPDINIFETITADEYADGSLDVLNLIVFDSVSITEYSIEGLTIIDINIYDIINAWSRATVQKEENFSDFARSYPFTEITETRVDEIEFEGGVKQFDDKWGRTKKVFQITFPVAQKADALPIQEFFESHYHQKFLFTSPITGVTYWVKFAESSYTLIRSHYETYFAGVVLEEVFG